MYLFLPISRKNRYEILKQEQLSHITCRDINVIYYLKCNMCDHKGTYIGKTIGDNVVGFKSRISQHIIDCRTNTFACKFPIHTHVYHDISLCYEI